MITLPQVTAASHAPGGLATRRGVTRSLSGRAVKNVGGEVHELSSEMDAMESDASVALAA